MICPDSDFDCDNPGCRRGGCQGRRPNLPLLRVTVAAAAKSLPLLDAALPQGMVARATTDRAKDGIRRGRLVAA